MRLISSTNDRGEKDRHKHHDRWLLAGLLGSYALTSRVLKAGESDDDEKITKEINGLTKRDTNGQTEDLAELQRVQSQSRWSV